MVTRRHAQHMIEEDLKEFYDTLYRLQQPCPWGDLTQDEGLENPVPFLPELACIPNIPLGLVVGCGHRIQEIAYRGVARTEQFGMLIRSDIINPNCMSKAYIFLDLTDPTNLHLSNPDYQPRQDPLDLTDLNIDLTDERNEHLITDYDSSKPQVHAIMSIGVFTYDHLGVHFPSQEIERQTAKALSDLLMPGGIIANDKLTDYSSRRFENILTEEFGFKKFHKKYGTISLQKPFAHKKCTGSNQFYCW